MSFPGGDGAAHAALPAPVEIERIEKPVDLFEYQARDLFEKHGVPVLGGVVAEEPSAAKAAAEQLGTPVVVVKAQVKTGGRGKAGGVKVAKSPEEAQERAAEILGMDIKGHTVHRVMIRSKSTRLNSSHSGESRMPSSA